ncbi:AMP-binding protein [Actinocorallia longicatena]|uniref:Acyl-CoA synthetase n=1 Tax=Actinocorallia longicatena TaxID=111803 RepID=A0ABP6Q889_9ACTN
MAFNLADLFETVADAVPDRVALVSGEDRLTYAELDDRADRAAAALAAAGVGTGDRVAILSVNRAEWLETQIAAYKLRAVPVNVNYRYTAGELAHVIADAGCAALVGERSLVARLGPARAGLTDLRSVFVLEDGTDEEVPDALSYADAVAAAPSGRVARERSGDDLYLLYTGGTTGLPKGVMWRSEDIFFAAMGGGNMLGEPVTSLEELAANAVAGGLSVMVNAPLMHGAGMWVAWATLTGGSKLVLWSRTSFSAEGVLEVAAREEVQALVLVGDAMARPIADALEAGDFSLPNLFAITTGGSVTSPDVKARLHASLPGLAVLLDAVGGSETGVAGQAVPPGPDGTPRFLLKPDSAVLDADLQPVKPGSDEIGVFARSGRLPLGYWKDQAKTDATFVTAPDGTRWALQGDMAKVDAEGHLVLLGRGSTVVNTGGEKVFVEEVEAALKSHPAVYDALVVGAPDERLGSRVAAVVSLTEDVSAETLRAHCRERIAGYKVPRDVLVVDEVRRTPSGKADYGWARKTVTPSS